MLKNLFIAISSIFITNHIYPNSTANVYCANNKMEWKWLKENGNIVSLSGDWEYVETESYWFSYFKLASDIKINDLQKKCIKEYGDNYKYVQPVSYGGLDDWTIFGTDEHNLLPGFLSYCKISSVNSCELTRIRIDSKKGVNQILF